MAAAAPVSPSVNIGDSHGDLAETLAEAPAPATPEKPAVDVGDSSVAEGPAPATPERPTVDVGDSSGGIEESSPESFLSSPAAEVNEIDCGDLPDDYYVGIGFFKVGPVAWETSPRRPAATRSPTTSPPKKKKTKPVDTLAGMSPAMRKLVRRGMSPKEGNPIKQPKELSPEQLSLAEERNAARIMRRKVAEFWSKQPHGFTSQDLYCVRTINLHSCSLNDDDGEALASVFTKEMVQLKQLDLFGNRFHDTTMAALAAAFARGAAPLVTHLLLGRNAISDVGLKQLVATLSNGALPRMQKLSLEHNLIGPDGATALAEAATAGAVGVNNLLFLSLSGNPIGDEGFRAFASACEDDEILDKLTDLHLCSTDVTDKGLAALAETLMPKNGGLPALRTLLVDEAHVSNTSLQQVHAARTGQGGVHAIRIQSF